MNEECCFYIKKYNLDKHLSNDIIKHTSIATFEKGQYVCNINEELTKLYFLVSGKAKVTTELSNGKSLLLSFYEPLSVIGDVEFISNPLADCNVITLDRCILLSIPLDVIRTYGLNDCNFLRFIIQMLEKKLRGNSNSSSINIYYPLENRFASYLLSIRSKDEINSNLIQLESLTHISELLGSSYRNLTRVIKSLTDRDIIIKSNNNIRVLNLELLEEIAGDIYK